MTMKACGRTSGKADLKTCVLCVAERISRVESAEVEVEVEVEAESDAGAGVAGVSVM